jgi:hypothetical protein
VGAGLAGELIQALHFKGVGFGVLLELPLAAILFVSWQLLKNPGRAQIA